MFFPEKIKNIKPSDRVLEIGPGANPHNRSDVLLEMKYESDAEYEAQLGHSGKLISGKEIKYYDGKKFPFKDLEFDYVICSHVLEHVDNPEAFLSEIFRVATKGYFEYPLIYYEYLYNFHVHKNILKFDGEKLWYLKKENLHLEEFRPVQQFFFETLQKGHAKLINDLLPLLMEGFEWNSKFQILRSQNINDVIWENYNIPFSAGNISKKTIVIGYIRKLFSK